jgi:uncharacterized protein
MNTKNLSHHDKCFCIRTNTENNYFVNKSLQKLLISHPIANFLLAINESGENLDQWIENYKNRKDNYNGSYRYEEIMYYYGKIKALQQYGLYADKEENKHLDGTYTSDDIKRGFFNTDVIIFETTERCNLRCYYCAYGELYKDIKIRKERELSIVPAKALLDCIVEKRSSIVGYNNRLTICFYGGEPLLCMTFIKEIVGYAKKIQPKNFYFKFDMITNGVLLNKHIDFLVKENFNITVSLDGNDYNNQYRVLKHNKPSYPLIYKNLKTLQKEYPKFFESNISFKAVLHNKNSATQIYKYFHAEFGKVANISPLRARDVEEDAQKEFWQMYTNYEESVKYTEDYSFLETNVLNKLPDTLVVDEFATSVNEYIYTDYNEIFWKKEKRIIPTNTCLPFQKRLFLTAGGDLMTCEKIDFKYSLGKIIDGKVEIDFENIAAFYNNVFSKIKGLCKKCFRTNTCSQCMFFLNMDNEILQCNGFINREEYLKLLINKLDIVEDKRALLTDKKINQG